VVQLKASLESFEEFDWPTHTSWLHRASCASLLDFVLRNHDLHGVFEGDTLHIRSGEPPDPAKEAEQQ
jgi:hypothetical protein